MEPSHLEILSRPQVIGNSKQYLLLRTDILRKAVIGCPWKVFDIAPQKDSVQQNYKNPPPPHSKPVWEIFAKMGHFDSVRSVMVFYWLFHKAVLQKDTVDANLAHIGVNLPENIARNGNVVYLPTFSFSTFFKRTWDFVLLWLGFPKINVPVISEDFLLPKCSKSEMLLKVSEDLLTIFEHFRRNNLLKKVMFLVCIVRHFEHKVNIKSLFWNIC